MQDDGTIATIGDAIEAGWRLTAHCPCGHTAELDLEALARRLGRDHSYLRQDLRKVSCGRCGGREWSMIVHPAEAPPAWTDRRP